MRKDIEFKAEDGVTLRGWLYQPDRISGPFPTIVMAHGFAGVKEFYLGDFAAVFEDAGFAVLVYDHRNFGASSGTPRNEIVPYEQVQDYRHAITFATTLSEVDPQRIGIWGTSYSAGHVLVVGAIDRRVKCVVSQVGGADGFEIINRWVGPNGLSEMRAGFDADRLARFRGEPPRLIPVVSTEPNERCALPGPDAAEFLLNAKNRIPTWENEVTLRSLELALEYTPVAYIPRISPTPLMMVLAKNDQLIPFDLALKSYGMALEPKKLLVLPCGHFEPYYGDTFTCNSAEQTAWFKTHLQAGRAAAA